MASTLLPRTTYKLWNSSTLPSSAAEEVMVWCYRLRMGMAVTVGSGVLTISDNE
jgi:hypothetical protein